MSKIFLTVLLFSSFSGCMEFIENKDITSKHFVLVSKYPLISEREFLLKRITHLFNSEIVTQESFRNIFSKSWVNNIRSRNNWFKDTRIEIKEYQPLANWNHNSFLTQSGLIISPTNYSINIDLISIHGAEEERFKLIECIRELQFQLIKVNKYIYSMTLENGDLKVLTRDSTLLFLDYKEFRGQLERLEDLIMFELSSGRLDNIKRLDFRYKNGVSVLFS